MRFEGTMADERRPISDAELDHIHRTYDGRQDGQPGGLGVQARDRMIRTLVTELRATRAELESARHVVRARTSRARNGVVPGIGADFRCTEDPPIP
jgi:hypothetical protein